jgi:hypothetical protein
MESVNGEQPNDHFVSAALAAIEDAVEVDITPGNQIYDHFQAAALETDYVQKSEQSIRMMITCSLIL